MKTRNLLCDICKTKIRKVESEYKAKRRKLKIKVVVPAISGKVPIKLNK